MTCIIQTFYNFELRFDSAVKLFARFHPYLFIVCAFIGIPVFILGMVFPDRGIYAAGGLPVRMVLRSLKMHPNTIFIRIRPG